MGTLLAMVMLAGAAAAGVLLVFVALSLGGPPEEAGGPGLRERFDDAYLVVAERVGGRGRGGGGGRRRGQGRLPLPERLSQAGMRLRPSEYLMAQALCALGLAALCALRFGASLVPVVGAVAGWLLPGFYMRHRARSRLRRLNDQLVDVLSLMSNSLKAGHSLPQTLELIAREGRPPLAEEFARCVRELRVGGSMENALTSLARRSGSDDLDLMVTAILVQTTVGGNLADTLDKISHTVRERVRIKGEIATATAQGRLSGWIISLLPVAVAIILFVVSPGYFRPMTQRPLGWLMLGAAALLILTGNVIIRRIVRIEV